MHNPKLNIQQNHKLNIQQKFKSVYSNFDRNFNKINEDLEKIVDNNSCQILFGSGSPTKNMNNQSGLYLDIDGEKLYYDKNYQWNSISLRGENGSDGVAGNIGPIGPTGATGPMGATGPTGPVIGFGSALATGPGSFTTTPDGTNIMFDQNIINLPINIISTNSNPEILTFINIGAYVIDYNFIVTNTILDSYSNIGIQCIPEFDDNVQIFPETDIIPVKGIVNQRLSGFITVIVYEPNTRFAIGFFTDPEYEPVTISNTKFLVTRIAE